MSQQTTSARHMPAPQTRCWASIPAPEAPQAALRRWLISVQRPDGVSINLERLGGHSVDHAMTGMELGGLGSVVRVRQLVADEAAA